jgi:hypothetical protein
MKVLAALDALPNHDSSGCHLAIQGRRSSLRHREIEILPILDNRETLSRYGFRQQSIFGQQMLVNELQKDIGG